MYLYSLIPVGFNQSSVKINIPEQVCLVTNIKVYFFEQNEENPNDFLFKKYNVVVPTIILFSKNGNIIGRWDNPTDAHDIINTINTININK